MTSTKEHTRWTIHVVNISLLYTKGVTRAPKENRERVEFGLLGRESATRPRRCCWRSSSPRKGLTNPTTAWRHAKPGDQIGRMAMTLGLAYQVTGHSRYAEKLRSALLYYSRYQKWHGKGLRRNDPPWHSELNTARFCFGFAVGYDSIHDYLSESDRKTIVDAVHGGMPTLGIGYCRRRVRWTRWGTIGRVRGRGGAGHQLSIIDDDSRRRLGRHSS